MPMPYLTPDPQPDPAPTREAIAALVAANDAALKALAAQGFGVEQVSIVGIKLAMLCDELLGDEDAPRRRRFEHRVASHYAKLITDLQSQVNRQRLLQGINLPGVDPRAN